MLRSVGIEVSRPAFIPFVGAIIVSKDIQSRNSVTEGWVGIAGPIAGTGASLAVLGAYALSGHDPSVLMALSGLLFNGFILIPVPPLDGGRTLGAVTPWIWIPGSACSCC